MKVARPRGHDGLVLQLLGAARGGLLPHALSFEGPAGIGKFLAARWLALGLLCEGGPGEPCRVCGPCKRVLSGGARGNHPDVYVLDPVEERLESIRVGRVARRPDAVGNDDPDDCIESFLALRAVEGRFRPILVRESHRMNTAAQNALLKTLEEPRPGTLLVLETHRPDLLLPTIKSRCVRVRFQPLEQEAVVEVLTEEGVDRAQACALAQVAHGAPGRALQARERGHDEILAGLGELLSGERDPLAVAAGVWELSGTFPGSTPTAQARERARTVLDLTLELALDAKRVAEGLAPEQLAHGALVPAAGELGPRAWTALLEELCELRVDVDRNLIPEALVERAFLALAQRATLLAPVGGGRR